MHESRELLQSEQASVKALQSQIISLESGIASSQFELEALRVSSQLASSEAAAAAAEHEVSLKVCVEAISIEAAALKSVHTAALDELQQKLSSAEEKAKEVERLEAELVGLRGEKGDVANRISEL